MIHRDERPNLALLQTAALWNAVVVAARTSGGKNAFQR
jgi:hypothetical protein